MGRGDSFLDIDRGVKVEKMNAKSSWQELFLSSLFSFFIFSSFQLQFSELVSKLNTFMQLGLRILVFVLRLSLIE